MMFFSRKALFLYIFIFLFSQTLVAQKDCNPERQDVGIIGGGTFYMGDLTDNYSLFRNFSYYVGGMYRLNFNDLYAARMQVAYGRIRGDMLRSDMPPTNDGQPWAFNRPMFLAEIAGEAGFIPLNVFSLRENKRWSPFLMGGFGFASLSGKDTSRADLSKQTFCGYLLVGVGVKYVPWKRITVGVEWVMRKTFSDDIDYYTGIPSSPLINKDWIGTLGITITYRLPQDNPCAVYSEYTSEPPKKKGKLHK